MRQFLMLAALFATVPAAAVSAQEKVTVTFDRGTSSKEIASAITGEADVEYLLTVRQGQVMQILFSRRQGSCYFNAFEPGTPDAAVHVGSTAGNEFGASPTKAGTYRFQVYQMRATARRNETCRFAISFEVTGEGTDAAPPPAAAPAAAPPEAAKGACLFRIKVDAELVGSTAVKPGVWELVMHKRGDGRRVTCTVTDRGTITGWVEQR